MMSNCVLLLALAVFGASANLVTSGFGTTGINTLNGGFGAYGTTVSDTCRCVKTVVRPRIHHTEVPVVTSVQRFVTPTVSSVVERIPYSVSRRVDTPTYTQTAGVFPGHVSTVGGLYSTGTLLNPTGAVGLVSGTTGLNGGYGGFGGYTNTVF